MSAYEEEYIEYLKNPFKDKIPYPAIAYIEELKQQVKQLQESQKQKQIIILCERLNKAEQQNEQMLECMIYEFKANVKRFGLNKAKILKSCFIIESVTGKKIEEILTQDESDE